MPKIYTKYDRPPTEYEKNSGKRKTERAGYVPANVRIEQMIYAGQRLQLARAEAFDIPELAYSESTIDEVELDPTRTPNFDLADATALSRAFSARFKARKAEIEAEKAKKIAEERAEFDAWKESKKNSASPEKTDEN